MESPPRLATSPYQWISFFDTNFKNGAFAYKDPLLREVALDFYASQGSAQEECLRAIEAWKSEESRLAIRTMLSDKLSADEYQRFMFSLFLLGRDTAQASDGGKAPTDKAAAMDLKEVAVLSKFAIAYGIDLQQGARLLD